MISFENTQIAFKYKTDADLKRGLFLFKAMKSPFIVKLGTILSNFAIKIHFPIKWAVKPTIYRHFVAGETIEECEPTIRRLEKFGVGAILDYSVEGVEDIEGVEKAMAETIRAIKNAGQDPNIPFSVFKPTAFTTHNVLEKKSCGFEMTPEEEQEAINFRNRIEKLCQTAFDANVPILVDAEDTFFQQFIDDVTEEMMQKFNKEKCIVFNTWQMYRHDRLEHLKAWYERAVEGNYYMGAKFVRGAYMEKERARAEENGYEDPIQPDKEATDRDYNLALKFTIEHIDRISVFNGTHNQYSSLYMTELMEKHGIAKDDPRCWFSQLYGMSDDISFNISEEGYNVAKYLPYGPVKHVLPYLLRRAVENTSVEGQTLRELDLLSKEVIRRKSEK